MLMYMTNKHFMRDIDSRVGEVLISHDFKLKKNSWYRHTEDFIQVLNLQKSYFSDLYYLNIGLDVKPDNISSYMPEYMFSVRGRAEMIIQNRELILSLDFTNDLSESDRQSKLNTLLVECVEFLNSIRSWKDFRKAIDNSSHPIHKAAITASFKQLLTNH